MEDGLVLKSTENVKARKRKSMENQQDDSRRTSTKRIWRPKLFGRGGTV